MAVFEDNWQTTRPTFRERSKFILNNDLFSDVKFVVGTMDGESESKRRKQVIPAHKLVLSIGSPVFEAMFYGKLAETTNSIEMPDCEYDSLLELFRYMYSDEVNLNGSNVMGVLYLAKKYIVPLLADKCMEFLEGNVDSSDVFSVLPFAQKYEGKELMDRCWEVIDKQTEEAVKSDGFVTIERSLLEAVVKRDTLTIEEIELFKAVDLWATKECERRGLAADGALKRRVLGETLVKALRFPTIKQVDFASVVLDSKILTPDEIITIIKCLSSVPTSPVEFPEIERPGFKVNTRRCCTYNRFFESSFAGDNCTQWTSILNLSVDKDITLHGVGFFGALNSSYSIDVEITDAMEKQVMGSKSGKCSPVSLRCKAGPYNGFEVMFDRGIVLVKNTMYCIQAAVNGYLTWHGGVHFDSVLCSGVTFTFNHKAYWRNGDRLRSSSTVGRIPELYFSL